MTLDQTAPVVHRLWPAASPTAKAARAVVLVALGTLVLWASAKVQVPFWPVPATLQTVAVVMIGAIYGARLGLATLLAYLAEGAAGLPVFAGTPEKGIGLLYMAGPTGGYLVGFAVAAFVVGFLIEKGVARSILATAGTVVAAHLVVHGLGLAWLSGFLGVQKAVSAGLMPFLLSDAVKMALSTALILAMPRPASR